MFIKVNTDTYGNVSFAYALIKQIKDVGINVKIAEDVVEHFAVIDDFGNVSFIGIVTAEVRYG